MKTNRLRLQKSALGKIPNIRLKAGIWLLALTLLFAAGNPSVPTRILGRPQGPSQGMFKGMPTGQEPMVSSNIQAELEVVRLVNIVREKAKLVPVVWDQDLARASRYHAADMANDVYFDHDTYDREGSGSYLRLVRQGDTGDRIKKFSTRGFSENIAINQGPQEVMEAWLKSPGHRRNIMDPDARIIGVGVHGLVWVQNFGR
jgi:uncharacterized protein YkwD